MMKERYNDTDLREALRRKYADTPGLPADFIAKMKDREGRAHGFAETPAGRRPVLRLRPLVRRWRWAAAACLIIIIGVGWKLNAPTLHGLSTESPRSISQSTTVNHSIEYGQSLNRLRSIEQLTTVDEATDHGRSPNRPRSTDDRPVLPPSPAENLHYAARVQTDDTLAYQAPGRMDEFIAKMADFNKVKAVALDCVAPGSADSTVVGTAYVFEDRQELDLFGRLLQAACWYDSKTPGYLLNFSRQQFYFSLKDQRQGRKYLWMAERIGGNHILLYSTHSPIEASVSSACFQEYREQLMHNNLSTIQF